MIIKNKNKNNKNIILLIKIASLSEFSGYC